jgi:hypothetical protein
MLFAFFFFFFFSFSLLFAFNKTCLFAVTGLFPDFEIFPWPESTDPTQVFYTVTASLVRCPCTYKQAFPCAPLSNFGWRKKKKKKTRAIKEEEKPVGKKRWEENRG